MPMNRVVRFLLIAAVGAVMMFGCAYAYLTMQGRNLITGRLEALTGRSVYIGYFAVTPPLQITVRNVVIDNFAQIDEAVVSPSIMGFFTGNIILNNAVLVRPHLAYDKAFVAPSSEPSREPTIKIPGSAVLDRTKRRHRRLARLVFKHLVIKDGRVDIMDRAVSSEGIKITLKDIALDVTNTYRFGGGLVTNFDAKAGIPWPQGKEAGSLVANGWIDFSRRDMVASVKINGIDGMYLYPYYASWIDLEKARVQKAKLNFFSAIRGVNNVVTADCHLELTDLEFKPRPEETMPKRAERIAAAVIDIFKTLNQGKIVLDFTFKTSMDFPEVTFGPLKLAFQDKIKQYRRENGLTAQDVMTFPARFLIRFYKTGKELALPMMGSAFDASVEVGKTIGKKFNRSQ